MIISAIFYLLLGQVQPAVEPKKEVVVYRENIEQYKAKLIAPIASWVESDLFRFKALDKELPVGEVLPSEQIVKKIVESQNISKNVIYDANFAWLSGENLLRKAKLVFYRKYTAFPPEGKEDILFEEVFRFIEPAVVNSYATQTFRFSGTEDDQISHYSPVVGAVRPIQASNRSDTIIDGEIALDDIFVFSANPNSFNIKLVDQKILFVPFASDSAQALEKAAPLFSYKNDSLERFDAASSESYSSLLGKQSSLEQRSLTLWNFEVKAFSSHASWLPLTVIFEPRQVYIYEIYPKDHFYSSAKQYLFVDAQTAIPYYKLVYSHSGKFLKTVIGGWQKLNDAGKESYAPAFVLAVDRSTRNASVVTINNAQFYSEKEPNLDFIFADQPKKEQIPLTQVPTEAEN